MEPHSEMVHWLFAAGFLLLGLILLSEAIVGEEVWARRRWRVYLWPSIAFGLGVLLWPVMTFFTNSAIHMIAHGAWAQALMVGGGAELGLVHGKLHSRWWRLALPVGILVSGAAFILHEQNSWYFARSAFLHHLIGWTLVGGSEKSHQNPCPCGCRSVMRYGWTSAQTIPPRLVEGPSPWTTRTRQVGSAVFASS